MVPGDFIITPPGPGTTTATRAASPVVWMDGLDSGIVQMFARSSTRSIRKEVQPVSRKKVRRSRATGNNLVPLAAAAPFGRPRPSSTIRTPQPRFARQAFSGSGSDSCHGWKDAVHEPADRRARDADHCRVHPACCRRASRSQACARPTAPSTASSKAKGRHASRMNTSRIRGA